MTFDFIEGSEVGGVVSNFNANTGSHTFTPTIGFVGNATFQYRLMDNTTVLATVTATVVVQCPTTVNNSCISPAPSIFMTTNCLKAGDQFINYGTNSPGILKLYNKDNVAIETINLPTSGAFQVQVPPLNTYDAYYMTLTVPGKAESPRSNILTVCPKEIKQDPCYSPCSDCNC